MAISSASLLPACLLVLCSTPAPEGWTTTQPRPEMEPLFQSLADGSDSILSIAADEREGLAGSWVRTFPVAGGRHYRFSCLRRTLGIDVPARSALVTITWQNDDGRLVEGSHGDQARPEFPLHELPVDDHWMRVTDVYEVPADATQARVELTLRWATSAAVWWKDVSLEPIETPAPRKVQLAAVHFKPQGGRSAADNRQMFAPLIAQAAAQGADLVCLGECLTKVGNGLSVDEAAEPMPGPSTEFFGTLAREHNLYIVAGLTERDGDVIYNVAALLGPDGTLQGKYRKVCLPREEIANGITPGHEYPVFDTRFGKLGLMVCWDVHFPEVARNLANNGAEVIAMPIWGGNPRLAAARAIENQIYLVTSTYNDRDGWMKTGIWSHTGDLLAEGTDWGTVVMSEVDLAARTQWWWLGDFKARIPREKPVGGFVD